jgi:hypothetical protein
VGNDDELCLALLHEAGDVVEPLLQGLYGH